MRKHLVTFALSLVCAFVWVEANAAYPVPQGVTLRAESDGLVLLWDPVHRQDLMGYSIWIRKKGESDYTRVRIPVKVGDSTKRMPMTTRARFRFPIAENGGIRLRRNKTGLHAELVVRSEFEEGKSGPSRSVFTRQAEDFRKPVEAMDEAILDGGEKEGGEDIEPTPEPTPFTDRPVGGRETLLLPPKKWEVSIGVEFGMNMHMDEGTNTLPEIGFVPFSAEGLEPRPWEARLNRTILSVPLTVQYGISEGLQLGATIQYRYEEHAFDTLYWNELNLEVRRVIWDVDHYRTLPPLVQGGFGDVTAHVRFQPLQTTPLLVNLDVLVPTAPSRFKHYIRSEHLFRASESDLGNGEGTVRPTLGVQFGYRGIRAAPYYFLSFSPGGTEVWTLEQVQVEYQAVHSDILEAGVGYTLPWEFGDTPGAAMFGAKIRAISPARITKGIYLYPEADGNPHRQNDFWKLYFESGTGLTVDADNQLEVFMEVDQHSGSWMRGRGRLFARLKSRGIDFGIGGVFVY